MATISEATRRTITTYGETVCLRCDEVINGFGESPMNAARSYTMSTQRDDLKTRHPCGTPAAGRWVNP